MLRTSPNGDGADHGGGGADHDRASGLLSHLQADTLGMLGHDVAAPLRVIMASAEMVLMQMDEEAYDPTMGLDRAEVRRSLEVILRNARRLEIIRQDLLTTAAADSGAIDVMAASVPVMPFLSAAADLAPARVTLAIDCEPDLSCVVQASHLSQMISNLVSNAVRHARSEVSLSASRAGGRVHIAVSDDGPGVPAEVTDRLFARFAHTGAAFRPQGAGSGLGLYIVRTLAGANQGRVVHLPGESGARFVIELPADA